MKFLITGGVPRFLGEFKSHGKALKHGELAIIDYDKRSYETKLTYETPKAFCPDNDPSIGFTSASTHEDELFVGTSTQALVISLADYRVKATIDHPSLHDVHHVKLIDDLIYVVNTGMDAIFRFTRNGDFVDGLNVLGHELWHRFKPEDHLRKITTTKPHESHPNHVFTLGKEIWVTRFEQKDAVNLFDLGQTIPIEVERPHDGLVVGDKVYFTTVNGAIIIADIYTKRVVQVVDLNELDPRKGRPLGWCRGLHIDGKYAYVGFTQLRSTAITDNVKWIKNIITEKKYSGKPLPTRISRYDLESMAFVDEMQLPIGKITALFSIIPI